MAVKQRFFPFDTRVSQDRYEWRSLKVQHRRTLFMATGILFALAILCVLLILQRNSGLCYNRRKMCTCNLIVPDIIHFYRTDKDAVNISKPDGVCIKAAGRFHDQVWVHTTDIKSTYQEMENLGLTAPTFKVLQVPYGPGPVHLNIIRNYGGIFMKNDIYLLDRLDQMRGYDWSVAGQNDIVAGTQEGIATGRQFKLKDILFDKNYGALYIRDLIQNCTYLAVRLGIR